MDQKKNDSPGKIPDFIKSSKSAKTAVYVVLGIAGIYLTGHIFRVFAYAIRGFKEFSSSLKE